MIVLDASAVVELLLDTVTGRRVATLITNAETALHVPHLLDAEAVRALRRLSRSKSSSSPEMTAIVANRQAAPAA